MTLGEKIQHYRHQAGLSQEQLADRIGVSRQAVSKWERGEAAPDVSNLASLARVLRVSADLLLSTAPPPDPETVAHSDEDPSSPPCTAFRSFRGFAPLLALIQRKGYIAGYILSGYCAIILLFLRIIHSAVRCMLPSPEILNFFDSFGISSFEAPFKTSLYIINAFSLLAIAGIICGFLLARYLKRKRPSDTSL